MYSDDNDSKKVNGSTSTGGYNKDGPFWVYWPDRGVSKEHRIDSIKTGLLYLYCPSIKLYKCPTGVHGEVITCAIVGAMNGYEAIPGADGQVLRNRMQIRRPGQGDVFLDKGRLSPASRTVWYDQKRW